MCQEQQHQYMPIEVGGETRSERSAEGEHLKTIYTKEMVMGCVKCGATQAIPKASANKP